MKASVKAPLTYRALLLLLSPLVLVYTLWRTCKDGGITYLLQRYGLAQPSTNATVWVHAASVGEINTVYPLLAELINRYPALEILVTTNTPTGKQALAVKNRALKHAYLPLDYSGPVRRFLSNNSFTLGIVVETEIWPTLYGYADFPLCIVNGRLSPKSMKHIDGILNQSLRFAASQLDLILARSDNDASSFLQLGVSPNKVEVIGNLKFANPTTPVTQPELPKQALPKFCLLASTHEDEEYQLAKTWLSREVDIPLVIAPRHPERSRAIQIQLKKLSTDLAVRSQGHNLTSSTVLYLADTLGEMNLWFSHAESIFMGGSLVPTGGHNMLEPAQLGKSVICGEHYQNFKDEVDRLLAGDAICIVRTSEAAVDALIEASGQPDLQMQRGQRALSLVNQLHDMQKRYADRLGDISSVLTTLHHNHLEKDPS